MIKLTPAEIIKKLLDYSGLTYPKFASKLGKDSPQFLRDIVKGKTKTISEKIIELITKAFPEINENWLKTGHGFMLDNSNLEIDYLNQYTDSVIPQDFDGQMLVEFRDLSVAAGPLNQTLENTPTRQMLVPREYDRGEYLVVKVNGRSMEDGTEFSIANGSNILIKKYYLENGDKLPIRGNLFVIDAKEGQALKQIVEHNIEEGYIICHSYNPDFKDYKV